MLGSEPSGAAVAVSRFDSTIICTPPIRTWVKVSRSVPSCPEWNTVISIRPSDFCFTRSAASM